MRDGVEDEDRDGREADDRIMPSSFLVLSLSLSQALLQDSKAQLGELRFLYLLQLQLSACRLTGDATKQDREWCSPNLAVQLSTLVTGDFSSSSLLLADFGSLVTHAS